ncbi:hypothetical protein IAQ67_14185 [Paenibacillus peoriae]|uniref:Uncharacterized protein n=1 Tax=Paenibacillus peoriae TaxID=59893 RepID=A0A7H0Y1W8_9BACL|nr:hypothetical protein IAQ67_14185 [Paenibacillus peoriae]
MRGFGYQMQREERLIWVSEATYLGMPFSTLVSAIDEGLCSPFPHTNPNTRFKKPMSKYRWAFLSN